MFIKQCRGVCALGIRRLLNGDALGRKLSPVGYLSRRFGLS